MIFICWLTWAVVWEAGIHSDIDYLTYYSNKKKHAKSKNQDINDIPQLLIFVRQPFDAQYSDLVPEERWLSCGWMLAHILDLFEPLKLFLIGCGETVHLVTFWCPSNFSSRGKSKGCVEEEPRELRIGEKSLRQEGVHGFPLARGEPPLRRWDQTNQPLRLGSNRYFPQGQPSGERMGKWKRVMIDLG